jgi:hypothetical protein
MAGVTPLPLLIPLIVLFPEPENSIGKARRNGRWRCARKAGGPKLLEEPNLPLQGRRAKSSSSFVRSSSGRDTGAAAPKFYSSIACESKSMCPFHGSCMPCPLTGRATLFLAADEAFWHYTFIAMGIRGR